MALRFFLVSLVAGLGIDPPSLPEVTSWVNSGRAWVQSRVDDLTGAKVIAIRDRADAEFDSVVADMAGTFTADLAMMDRSKVKTQIAFEPILVPDLLELGVARALNRQSSGQGISLIAVSPPYELVGPPAESAHGVVARSATDEPARTTRLASAVRLTRQAALAWLTLLRETDQSQVCY